MGVIVRDRAWQVLAALVILASVCKKKLFVLLHDRWLYYLDKEGTCRILVTRKIGCCCCASPATALV